MRKSNCKFVYSKLFVPAIITSYIMILAISYIAKTDPWIWYDEAGQFWIGKGLNHDSPPLSPDGGIADVIRNNHDYNMDPGGFGLIIHYWEKISCHYLWLRTLPFLFFILSMICSAYLGLKWSKDRNVALLMALAPCTVPLLYNEAFEIRAYSMEVLGVYLAVIGLMKLSKKLSFKNLITYSLILSVFITSRYSFIPVAFIASLYVLFLIYKSDLERGRKLAMSFSYSFPLFFTLFAIYMMALRIQNPRMEQMTYLYYLRDNPIYLIKESSMCFLLLHAFIIWMGVNFSIKEYFRKHEGLVYLLFASTLLFIMLSFMGIHPWIPKLANGKTGTRCCISLITLATIAISAILCEFNNLLSKRVDAKFLILFLICFQFLYINADEIRHFRQRDTCLTEYQSVMSREAKIFIDRSESPAMRYLFEYGLLAGTRNNYPEGITFTTATKHCFSYYENTDNDDKIDFDAWCMSFPSLNEMMEYDILIVPELKRYKPEERYYWHELGEKGVFVKREF